MIETISKYKETTIGKIPEDWKVTKLRNIIKLGNGRDYKHLQVGEIPVYGTGGIMTYVNDYLFDGKTVGIGRKGSIDKPVLLNGKFWTVDTLFYIKEFFDVDVDYVFNLFQSINWMKYNEATGLPSLSQNNILNIEIGLPKLDEQKKIAEVLSTWDKGIQETGSIIKRLEKRNKALAFSLFQNQNWNNKQLKELFARITDKNIENNKTVTTISAKRGFIKQEDFFNKTVASEVLTNYYLINKGDFCYNKSYSKGYDWGVVKRLNDFEKAVVTTLYICFRLIAKKQNSDFWELYFSSGILDRGLSKIAHEGGRAHGLLNVTSGDFFSLKVAVPSLEEQNKIAEILTTANKELHQYRQKLDNLKTQKKGLMQQLLTGKVRTM